MARATVDILKRIMNLSRRDLIVLSGSAFGNAMLSGSPVDERVPWYQSMRRCGQINFNERDPIELNIDD
jgi:hypothetical protein